MPIIKDTDIQWRYKNNDNREAYLVGGEVIADQDNTVAGSTFIVCGIPKGNIVLRAMAYVEGAEAITATVKSQDPDTMVNIVPSVDADTGYGLETITVDKVNTELNNIVVTFTDDFVRGRVVVLLELVDVDKLGNGGIPNITDIPE